MNSAPRQRASWEKVPDQREDSSCGASDAFARELVWLEQHIDTWDSRGNPVSERGRMPPRSASAGAGRQLV